MRALKGVDCLSEQCPQPEGASHGLIDTTREGVSQRILRIDAVAAAAAYPGGVGRKSTRVRCRSRSDRLWVKDAIAGARHELVRNLRRDPDARREVLRICRPKTAIAGRDKHQAASQRQSHLCAQRVDDGEIEIVVPVVALRAAFLKFIAKTNVDCDAGINAPRVLRVPGIIHLGSGSVHDDRGVSARSHPEQQRSNGIAAGRTVHGRRRPGRATVRRESSGRRRCDRRCSTYRPTDPGRTRVHLLGVPLFQQKAVCRITVLLEIGRSTLQQRSGFR